MALNIAFHLQPIGLQTLIAIDSESSFNHARHNFQAFAHSHLKSLCCSIWIWADTLSYNQYRLIPINMCNIYHMHNTSKYVSIHANTCTDWMSVHTNTNQYLQYIPRLIHMNTYHNTYHASTYQYIPQYKPQYILIHTSCMSLPTWLDIKYPNLMQQLWRLLQGNLYSKPERTQDAYNFVLA